LDEHFYQNNLDWLRTHGDKFVLLYVESHKGNSHEIKGPRLFSSTEDEEESLPDTCWIYKFDAPGSDQTPPISDARCDVRTK
jgi:hypothetical protein